MPNLNPDDTIAAVATAAGEGAIAVIRISGPEALSFAAKIFFPRKGRVEDFRSHTLHSGKIKNSDGETIDEVLLSIFRKPRSYTGEDVVEISCHGSAAVSKTILDLLVQNGARHAEPGEFTRRAFLNGKIDLTQAEAVLDLIKAKGEKSRQVALRQLAGSLSRKFQALKTQLMTLLAHMEASLDFPDEHLEVFSDRDFAERLGSVKKEMENLLANFKRGSLLREGAAVVLVGKPNVGKSSLFNVLLRRDRTLVSEFPGTTRDRIEESIEVGGLCLRLVDTAGLSPVPAHPLDKMGAEATRTALGEADLFLYIVDASAPLEEADRFAFQETDASGALILINKSDLPRVWDLSELKRMTGQEEFLTLSTRTREGIDLLEKKIVEKLSENSTAHEGEQITRLRHKNALERAVQALLRAEQSFQDRQSLEFAAGDLKAALDDLRELVGEVYSEDLLDVIFSEFCIGK